MTKERFAEILKEYKFTDHQIDLLWSIRPSDDLDEEHVRETAKRIASIRDVLAKA